MKMPDTIDYVIESHSAPSADGIVEVVAAHRDGAYVAMLSAWVSQDEAREALPIGSVLRAELAPMFTFGMATPVREVKS